MVVVCNRKVIQIKDSSVFVLFSFAFVSFLCFVLFFTVQKKEEEKKRGGGTGRSLR